MRSLVAALLLVPLAGCAPAAPGPTSTPEPAPVLRPLPDGAADYQLGGGYSPDGAVVIVVRDSGEPPAPGRYGVCYLNGFQTQPGALERWSGITPDVLLRDAEGRPVADPDWPDEVLLDHGSEAQRAAILAELAPAIADCAGAGVAAVEFDNLDTYTRDPRLTREGAFALAAGLVALAHDQGLAAGQKNSAEDAAALRAEAGFDFAVAEECLRWQECESYLAVYGEQLIAIEYTDDWPDPAAACAAGRAAGLPRLLVADRLLAPLGATGHHRSFC